MPDLLATPRRIAFAGDWHANTTWAVSAVEYAADQGADIVIHVGDFGYEFRSSFLRRLTKTLDHVGLQLWFVDGNHEDFDLLHRYPVRDTGLREVTDRIWHIPRGHRWTWGGVSFLGCGGAHSVDRTWREPGTSWWWQEAITDDDVARCVDGGPADVLVAHDCPTGVVVPGIDDRTEPPPFPPLEIARANEHRAVLRRVVDGCRPRLIVHGHYHVAYEQSVTLGHGSVRVVGLAEDGSALDRNVRVFDIDELVVADA